jgi:hypothetical protein
MIFGDSAAGVQTRQLWFCVVLAAVTVTWRLVAVYEEEWVTEDTAERERVRVKREREGDGGASTTSDGEEGVAVVEMEEWVAEDEGESSESTSLLFEAPGASFFILVLTVAGGPNT